MDADTPETATWYRVQRIDLAQAFDYFADFTRYNHWVRLKIELDGRFDVLLSVTGVGRNTGALAAVVGAWEVSSGGDDGSDRRPVQVVSQDPLLRPAEKIRRLCESVSLAGFTQTWRAHWQFGNEACD